MVALQGMVREKDDALREANRVIENLREQLAEYRDREIKGEEALKNEAGRVRDLLLDASVKRETIEEFDRKMRLILAENRALRGICSHNRDLLDEIDTKAAENAALRKELVQEKERAQDRAIEHGKLLAAAVLETHAAQSQKDGLEQELRKLKTMHVETIEACASLRTERDELATWQTKMMLSPRYHKFLAEMESAQAPGKKNGSGKGNLKAITAAAAAAAAKASPPA
jgi:hypothetical protein